MHGKNSYFPKYPQTKMQNTRPDGEESAQPPVDDLYM